MVKRSKVPWESVDWSLKNEEIVELTGCELSTVVSRRRNFERGGVKKEKTLAFRMEPQIREAVEYQARFLDISLTKLMKMVLLDYLSEYPVTYTDEESGLRKLLSPYSNNERFYFKECKFRLQKEIDLRSTSEGWRMAVEIENYRLQPFGLDQESRQRKREEAKRAEEIAKQEKLAKQKGKIGSDDGKID